MKKIESEHDRRVFASTHIPPEDMPGDRAEREAAVDAWLERHPEVIVGAPANLQEARRWHNNTTDHRIPLREEPGWLTILNTSILTNYGGYEYRPITLDEARGLYAAAEYGPQMVQSAVGHAGTAAILHDLLGEAAGLLNRMPYAQSVGQRAIVFKLRGRPPEGAILSREEVEAIGYDFGLLTRTS